MFELRMNCLMPWDNAQCRLATAQWERSRMAIVPPELRSHKPSETKKGFLRIGVTFCKGASIGSIFDTEGGGRAHNWSQTHTNQLCGQVIMYHIPLAPIHVCVPCSWVYTHVDMDSILDLLFLRRRRNLNMDYEGAKFHCNHWNEEGT